MTEQIITPEEKPKKKGGGVLGFLNMLVTIIMILVIVALGYFLMQSKLMKGTPSVAGYNMYIVLSGSMNPEFDAGSVIFVKPVPPEEIVSGDVITYHNEDDEKALTTHRVVKTEQNEGEIIFTTKGDANDVEDFAPVSGNRLVGRKEFHIPYLGLLLNFIQTKNGLLYFIIIPGVLIMLLEFRNLYKYAVLMEAEKLEKKRREEAQNSQIAE